VTWLDGVVIVFIGLIVFGGYRRGLILEVCDLVVLALGLVVTFNVYTHLTAVMVKFLHWNKLTAMYFSFFVIFIPIALLLYILGLNLDKNYKHVIPKILNDFVGIVLGFGKGLFLAWLLVLTMAYFPMEEASHKALGKGPVARAIQGLSPVVAELAGALTSPSIAKIIKQSIKGGTF
jgi:uncharacterized membrane protein required for colicin V production